MKKNIMMFLVSLFIVSSIFGLLILFGISNTSSNPSEPSNKTNDKVYYQVSNLKKKQENAKYLVTNYEEYQSIINMYNAIDSLYESDFKDYNYLIILLNIDECREKITDIKSMNIDNGDINIVFDIEGRCGYCAYSTKIFYIRLDKKINTYNSINFDYNYTRKQECDPLVVDKPVIYLYPTKDMYVNVKLSNPSSLTTTYPKYNNGWNVYAKTNGDLIDNKGKTYYALYWESLSYNIDNSLKEGFVVNGEDTIDFLEEKLKILGLNERESNEFIMYWLPQLEKNKYNYIRFATMDEINNIMELDITPKVDTLIRVLMVYKPLDSKIDVEEQQLFTPSRNGFTVVEWGGTKLN